MQTIIYLYHLPNSSSNDLINNGRNTQEVKSSPVFHVYGICLRTSVPMPTSAMARERSSVRAQYMPKARLRAFIPSDPFLIPTDLLPLTCGMRDALLTNKTKNTCTGAQSCLHRLHFIVFTVYSAKTIHTHTHIHKKTYIKTTHHRHGAFSLNAK